MAKYRNVSDDTLEVRYGGQHFGPAEPDAEIEIPDDIAKRLEFPESLWKVVSQPATTKRGK